MGDKTHPFTISLCNTFMQKVRVEASYRNKSNCGVIQICHVQIKEHIIIIHIGYLDPFTGQDVYRLPELAAFPMGRTCISVLTGLAVSDTEKPRYIVL